jgi:hypothetical protein
MGKWLIDIKQDHLRARAAVMLSLNGLHSALHAQCRPSLGKVIGFRSDSALGSGMVSFSTSFSELLKLSGLLSGRFLLAVTRRSEVVWTRAAINWVLGLYPAY